MELSFSLTGSKKVYEEVDLNWVTLYFLYFNIWFPLKSSVILSVTDFIGPFWLLLFLRDREVCSVSVRGSKGMWSGENTANMFVILLSLGILSTPSLSPTILHRTLLFPCISVSKDCIFWLGQTLLAPLESVSHYSNSLSARDRLLWWPHCSHGQESGH